MTDQVGTDRRYNIEVGELLRNARDQRRLSIRDLATQADLSKDAIQNMEAGRACFRRTYVATAQAYGVDPRLVLDAVYGSTDALARLQTALEDTAMPGLPHPSTLDDDTLWNYQAAIADELHSRYDQRADTMRASAAALTPESRRTSKRPGDSPRPASKRTE